MNIIEIGKWLSEDKTRRASRSNDPSEVVRFDDRSTSFHSTVNGHDGKFILGLGDLVATDWEPYPPKKCTGLTLAEAAKDFGKMGIRRAGWDSYCYMIEDKFFRFNGNRAFIITFEDILATDWEAWEPKQ